MADVILGVEVRHDLGYDRVTVAHFGAHELMIEKATRGVNRYTGTCTCERWVKRDQCPRCLGGAFLDHVREELICHGH